MTFAALLWDLDGTLVDSEPVHRAATDDALAALGLSVSDDFHARTLGVNDETVHAMLVAEAGASLALAKWRAVKGTHYRRHATDIRRRPGVADAAVDWAARGTPTAIVSNSSAEEVTIALPATGLDPAHTVVVSFADVPRGKPEPQGYRLAAQRLGVAPGACLVIEDSPIGAAAGNAAGMAVIFHPQSPANDAAEIAPGAYYLPPDEPLADLVFQAMTTGRLP
jgi:beta-phosphoglucomutase-like phosphatase (HAD superfamily)